MKIHISTVYHDRSSLRILVRADGKVVRSIICPTYKIVNERNRECERWSDRPGVAEVTSDPIHAEGL